MHVFISDLFLVRNVLYFSIYSYEVPDLNFHISLGGLIFQDLCTLLKETFGLNKYSGYVVPPHCGIVLYGHLFEFI